MWTQCKLSERKKETAYYITCNVNNIIAQSKGNLYCSESRRMDEINFVFFNIGEEFRKYMWRGTL